MMVLKRSYNKEIETILYASRRRGVETISIALFVVWDLSSSMPSITDRFT